MERPTRSSWLLSHRSIVLILLFSVTAINYLDRQTLSVIAPILHNQISLSTTGYSHIVFMFLLGYTIGQSLDGKFIDKVGTYLGMSYCVALWSIVSVLHSLAVGVLSLGILRFLLGIAEAGNWPGAVKAVAENCPPERRAFAVGIFNSGSTAGAIIAPPLVASIVGRWGWRLMFVAIGVTGIVWLSPWKKFYRNAPADIEVFAPSTPKHHSPTRRLLREKAVWALVVARFFSDPVWWFYAFWLPEYLAQSRGFSLAHIGRTTWVPFVFAGAGGWLGGIASDLLVRRGSTPVAARKFVMVIGALLMLCGIPAFRVRSSTMALALISVVLMAYTGWASNILSLVADLFPAHQVAQITGLSGTSAAIGGMVLTLATGWLVENVSYGSVFIVTSVMIVCALGVILCFVPRSRIVVG